MALAGFPLRKETSVFMLRKGGPFYMPVDPVDYVNRLLPTPTDTDYAYLASQGMVMDPAYRVAMASGEVEVQGLPQGAWFGDREPVLTVTGPSALVSFLEPQIIWLQFRIRVATLARLAPETLEQRLGVVTCERSLHVPLRKDPAGTCKDISRARRCILLRRTGTTQPGTASSSGASPGSLLQVGHR